MKKKIVVIVLVAMFLVCNNFSYVYSDETKDRAEQLIKDLNNAGMTEESLKGNGFMEVAEKKGDEIGKCLVKLTDSEENLMNVIRYFYSYDDKNRIFQACRLLLFPTVKAMWQSKYTGPEILFKKLLPIAVNNKEPNDLRMEVLGSIADCLDAKRGIKKELTPGQLNQLREGLKQIVFKKGYNLPEEKKRYGPMFNVRANASMLFIEEFEMDDESLKQLLWLVDNKEEEIWVKEKIFSSLYTAILRDKLNAVSKTIFYNKLTYIIENKDKYNEDFFKYSFGILSYFKDKKALDYLYSLMTKTTDCDALQRAKKAYTDNYFVFMDKTKTLQGEYLVKAREVLKQRITDNNPAIRKFCLEELLKEITGTYKVITHIDKITGADKIIELDKDEKKQLKELFINAKQKEKDEKLIKLLDKGLEKLNEEMGQ